MPIGFLILYDNVTPVASARSVASLPVVVPLRAATRCPCIGESQVLLMWLQHNEDLLVFLAEKWDVNFPDGCYVSGLREQIGIYEGRRENTAVGM